MGLIQLAKSLALSKNLTACIFTVRNPADLINCDIFGALEALREEVLELFRHALRSHEYPLHLFYTVIVDFLL